MCTAAGDWTHAKNYGIKEQELRTCEKVFLVMWLDIRICCLLPWLHIIVLSVETTPVFCSFLRVVTPHVLLLASFSIFLNNKKTFSIHFSRLIKGLYHFKVFFNIFTILYEPCEMQSSITYTFKKKKLNLNCSNHVIQNYQTRQAVTEV